MEEMGPAKIFLNGGAAGGGYLYVVPSYIDRTRPKKWTEDQDRTD